MSFKDINPGKHLAKPLQGGFDKKTGEQIGVEFLITSTNEKIWWFGNLKGKTPESTEKCKEITFTALALMGWDEDTYLKTGNFIFSGEEVEITVEMNTYNGETKPKVSWVNEPGGKKFSGMPVTEVKSKLISAGIDIKKEMAAIRAKKGIKDAPKASEPAPF